MKNNIPTEEDWGGYQHDMDQADAYKIFFGRTTEEMAKEFSKHITARTTDLKFMPKLPFRYYVIGFKNFVMSNKFSDMDAPDVVNCFVSLIEEKLRDTPDYVLPILDELLNSLEYIANHQQSYGASIHIYGDFREKLETIKNLASKAGNIDD